MTTDNLSITSADGARTTAMMFLAAAAPAPVIVIWPAMGVSARYYKPLAQALAAAGLHAVTPDLRGIGASSMRASRRTDFGYRELVELDFPAAIAAVRGRFPQSKIFLLGHSLGGQLSALYAAREPHGVDGLIFVAAGSVWHQGWNGARAMSFLAFTQFAALTAAALGYFPGKRLGFGGTEARSVMRDWAASARHGRYLPRGSSFDYEAALPQVRLPVLGISFEHDRFAPQRAAQNLLDKLPAAHVTRLHLTAAQSGRRLDHFNWVHEPNAVVTRIGEWLRQPEVKMA